MLSGEEFAFFFDRHEMYVCVIYFEADDCLSYLAAGECCLDGVGYLLSEDLHARYLVVSEVEEIIFFALRDYECMALANGVDVEKCVELVVFSALIAWDFAFYDTGKYS